MSQTVLFKPVRLLRRILKKYLPANVINILKILEQRLKKHLPVSARVLNMWRIYNYNYNYNAWVVRYHLAKNPTTSKEFIKGKDRKRILFYPNLPLEGHAMYQICLLLGCSITNNVTKSFDLAFKWKDSTFCVPDTILTKITKIHRIVNINSNDISKSRVGTIFYEVFGYSAEVDPLTFRGKCVQKSILNAGHDGKIIDCPIEELDEGFVYQKIINNKEIEGNLVMDIRVPIFKHVIPCVFLKFRPVEARFSFENTTVQLAEVSKIFTQEEIGNIFRFCEKMGLDYGELDVLRDKTNKRIYIVDVNNTPSGSPIEIGWQLEGLQRQAILFAEVFL